jgi:hypothetical protein
MKGKRVAIANDGAHRDFFNTVFAFGGIKTSDVALQALEDNEQVQLANSGRLDYASPSGAAQTVQLMNQGWYRIVGTEDLLNGLPPGDPRVVATIGDTGPACTKRLSREKLRNNPSLYVRGLSNYRPGEG